MQAVTTIGLDIAKSVFQIHGVDAAGNVIVRRQLKRRYVLPFLSEAAAVPHRHRSLRFVASLVTRAQSAGAYGAPDARGLREALRQAAEERCCRR
jgi:transposase